ncbi:hypothetical protein EOPP23_15610 [Endozoicomonas sp. OPT23]|uniref:hypothetical protein n=1 Tax=Endozoicomonas sp. OPT23 TaxID=2072845 RepID=UPI00129B4A02|nr:hypothetical protein [Endozoicomonas sp. OPT23]MRI34415.1 hypothetical protein [Endozoicomonas sp. OPT23]
MDSEGIGAAGGPWQKPIKSEPMEPESSCSPSLITERSGIHKSLRPLSDFQLQPVTAGLKLQPDQVFPKRCPDWLLDQKTIYNDLKYFSKYFSNAKSKKDFLNGEGRSYNRLIICLKKLDEFEKNGTLGSDSMIMIRSWLDQCLSECPLKWRTLPLVLNHTDEKWKIPQADQHFFDEDSLHAEQQHKLGDFAPPWMEDFQVGDIPAHTLTFDYWNARMEADGKVSLTRLREDNSHLCALLSEFQLRSSTDELVNLQIQAIRDRLNYTDNHLNGLKKLAPRFKYRWEAIPSELARAKRKRVRVNQDAPDISAPDTKKNNKKNDSEVKKYYRKKHKDGWVEFDPIRSGLPEVGSDERILKTEKKRVLPPQYCIHITSELLGKLMVSDHLMARETITGQEAVWLMTQCAAELCQVKNEAAAADKKEALGKLVSLVKEQLEALYVLEEVSVEGCLSEQKQGGGVEEKVELKLERHRGRLALLSLAFEETSTLTHSVNNYTWHFTKGHSGIPNNDQELKEELLYSRETDINMETGLPQWFEPSAFLTLPISNIIAALTPPSKGVRDKVQLPASLMNQITGVSQHPSEFLHIPERNAGIYLCNYLNWVVDVAVNPSTDRTQIPHHLQSAHHFLSILLVHVNQNLSMDDSHLVHYQQLRRLKQEFSRYTLLPSVAESTAMHDSMKRFIADMMLFYNGMPS